MPDPTPDQVMVVDKHHVAHLLLAAEGRPVMYPTLCGIYSNDLIHQHDKLDELAKPWSELTASDEEVSACQECLGEDAKIKAAVEAAVALVEAAQAVEPEPQPIDKEGNLIPVPDTVPDTMKAEPEPEGTLAPRGQPAISQIEVGEDVDD